MTARAVPSSDRLALRALARRLRPEAVTSRIPTLTAPSFVRLAAPEAAAPVAAPAATAVTPAAAPAARPLPSPPEDLAGSGGWGRLIEWCVVDLGVDSAILTDDRGLVIASAGLVDLDDAQGIAARLVIAFHQADRMGATRSPSMAIQLATGWLTGLRIDNGGDPVTLGIMAARPVDDATREVLVRAIGNKLREG